jgi:phosphoribosyl-ATP pyrophosphohydrolase
MTEPHAAHDLWRRLDEMLAERVRQRPAGSYVTELLDGGHPAMATKVIEEAYELVEACGGENDPPAIVHEAADLVFHAMVLLAANDIRWQEVEAELSRRFGIGGLTEKAARQGRPS